VSQFTQIEIANWIAIYLAAGLCCAIALCLSVGVAAHGLWQDKAWTDVRTVRGAALFLPKAWWRWQKLYLLSTPVTLAIVGWFAATLSWS
jgi:uncharacterized membrane protein (DUF2068 family)